MNFKEKEPPKTKTTIGFFFSSMNFFNFTLSFLMNRYKIFIWNLICFLDGFFKNFIL